MIRTTIVALLVLGLASCSKGGAAPAPATPVAPAPAPDPTPTTTSVSDADLEALMIETVGYLGKVAIAVETAGGDCPAMAAGIEKVVADHASLLERARTLDDPSVEDRSEKWLEAHEEQVKPTFERLFNGLSACNEDAAVQAAVEKMGGA